MSDKVSSVVTNVVAKGLKGDYYNFNYTFEDGTEVSARHKTDAPKANVGEVAEYQIKFTNDWGNVGSVGKPYGGGAPSAPSGGSGIIPASNYPAKSEVSKYNAPQAAASGSKNGAFALSYAKDVMVAIIATDKAVMSPEDNDTVDRTLRIAERFLTFLNNH